MEGEGVRDLDRFYDYAMLCQMEREKDVCACPSVCLHACERVYVRVLV